MKKSFNGVTLVFVSVLSFVLAGLCFFGLFTFIYGGFDSLPHATKFAAVYKAIERDYVGEADMEQVSDAAFSAMLESINDRWSYYMTAENYEEYKQYQKNIYTGIGVTIELDEDSGLFSVLTVTEDSPAQQAGVEIGDLLCAVDGEDLTGLTSAQVKEKIAKKQGESFELSLRVEDGSERTVTVKTNVIYTKPVKYEMLDGSIGYIKIRNFETDAGEMIISALDDLVAQGAKSIVFDVRNNPGGLLSELLKALDHILPEGDIFVSVDKQGNENIKTSDADCVKLPMTVLLNENSFSAAEFFAAALSEYDWAKLVGVHSTGKARSQVNIELTDGSAVHLSTNSYLTPKRIDLAESGGLIPDITIEMTQDDEAKLISGVLDHDKDSQLIGARNEIKARIVN